MFKIPMVISRSIEINKPASEVFSLIAELNNWTKWSPWSHVEPNAKVTVTGNAAKVGQKLAWDGPVTGSGEMTWTEIQVNEKLVTSLEFFKPWKSKSQVIFSLNSKGPSTIVNWTMHSTLPFFMIFFKKMMVSFMQSDFDRGLKNLKELSETGEVCSQSKYLGIQSVKGFYYVGKRTTCKISDISSSMSRDFEFMQSLVKNGKLPPPKMGLSLTHKWDFANGVCEYTTAFAYDQAPSQTLPEGLYQGQYSDHKALQVSHLGAYRNLGNAWAMAMGHQRALKHKVNKQLPLYEMYLTPPGTVAERDLNTQISIPTV